MPSCAARRSSPATMTRSRRRTVGYRRPWKKFLAAVGSSVRAAASRDGWGVPLCALCALGAARLAAVTLLRTSPPELPRQARDGPALDALASKLAWQAQWAPASAGPELSRAYVESLRRPALSEAAIAAIRQSYRIEPFGPDATAWRLRFVFEHWGGLPPDVRESATAELAAAFPRHGWAMRGLPDTVSDPSGRMVAALLFDRMRASQSQPPIRAPSEG